MKLKYTEIKTHREKLLLEQGQCCALCGEQIIDDAVLDHDHKTGLIRRVLHRGCNLLLGKIENNLRRNGLDLDKLKHFADNLVGYLLDNYEQIEHPTHKTNEERKIAARKRAKKRRKIK
jgi:hypothetical protein